MDIKISVIIPIYNRTYCLARCLDSVLFQTFTDWECILIDDGSTDGSLSVCRHYAETDSRFRVYSQSNSGASVARNRGVESSPLHYYPTKTIRHFLPASPCFVLPGCQIHPVRKTTLYLRIHIIVMSVS